MIDHRPPIFVDRVAVIEFNIVTTACPVITQVIFWDYYDGRDLHVVDTAPIRTVLAPNRSVHRHDVVLEFIDENLKRSIRRRVFASEIIDTQSTFDPSIADMADWPIHKRRRLKEPKRR